MDFIYGNDLNQALESDSRAYLCGDLKKPQKLQWIHDEKNEMGTSYYKQFTADQPHFHSVATEYNYVINGCSKVLLIEEQKEFIFEPGSVFVIPPMTKYASKHLANTKILFFKTPGGNDKKLIEVSADLEDWLLLW